MNCQQGGPSLGASAWRGLTVWISEWLAGYHIVLSPRGSIHNLPVFPEGDPLHLMIFHSRERESFSKLFITVSNGSPFTERESAGAIEVASLGQPG